MLPAITRRSSAPCTGLKGPLASPAPGREPAWKHRAGASLVGVLDSLNVHRESLRLRGRDSRGGSAVGAASGARGGAQSVLLLKDGGELLVDLEKQRDDPKLTCEAVRKRAWNLALALRNHQALEADLILEAFDLDIGGEG